MIDAVFHICIQNLQMYTYFGLFLTNLQLSHKLIVLILKNGKKGSLNITQLRESRHSGMAEFLFFETFSIIKSDLSLKCQGVNQKIADFSIFMPFQNKLKTSSGESSRKFFVFTWQYSTNIKKKSLFL